MPEPCEECGEQDRWLPMNAWYPLALFLFTMLVGFLVAFLFGVTGG